MISIIVPAYNVEKSLNKCIDSILEQTYTDFEIIIVNDGSFDKTRKIAESFNDYRIKIINKENGGLTSARLAGFKEAKGEYICFIDSDDYLENDYLEYLYNNFDDADIVISSYFVEDNAQKKLIFENETIDKQDFTEKFILPSISYVNHKKIIPNFVWLRLYRKSIINENCFVSEREVYTEDLFFQFYALLNARKVKITNKPLYHYVINSNSLTIKYRPNKYEMLKKRYNKIMEYLNNNSINLPQNKKDGLTLSLILSSVRNSVKSKNYDVFKRDCILIKEEYKDFFNQKISFKNKNDKIIFVLMKLDLYMVLFKVLK